MIAVGVVLVISAVALVVARAMQWAGHVESDAELMKRAAHRAEIAKSTSGRQNP